MAEIIKRLNELFTGEGLTNKDRLNYLHTIKDKVMENSVIVSRIEANESADQVMLGDFPAAVQNAVMDSLDTHSGLAENVLRDKEVREMSLHVCYWIRF